MLFAGAAIDRGLSFINWHFIKLGLMGEQAQICPSENAVEPIAQQEPETSDERVSSAALTPEPTAPSAEPAPVLTQVFRAPPAPITLPALAPSPMRAPEELGLIKSLGAKPQASNTTAKDKDRDEPAVNVDLSKGRKDSASNALK
jgi:hypothetical protein